MLYGVSLIDVQISDSRNPGCRFAFMVIAQGSSQKRILFIYDVGI